MIECLPMLSFPRRRESMKKIQKCCGVFSVNSLDSRLRGNDGGESGNNGVRHGDYRVENIGVECQV